MTAEPYCVIKKAEARKESRGHPGYSGAVSTSSSLKVARRENGKGGRKKRTERHDRDANTIIK